MVVNEFLRNFAAKLNNKTIKFFNSNMREYRKKYEKPSMQVFELKQQSRLLAGSNGGYRDNPYGAPIDY